LIDGSDSTIASQTLAAANGLALARSLEEIGVRAGFQDLRLRVHPVLLFNPDSRTANLLIPGLFAILLTFSGTLLAAFAIVRERERGTLEQLMVTPVSPVGVILGKLLPYLALGFAQLLLVLFLMTTVFRVPIHGNLFLLLGLSFIYLFALLSLGLLVSSRAKTQMEAIQAAQGFLLPSIMLSGYIFPLSSLPVPLRVLSQLLPATHFIAISRGIIIRGAGFLDLWQEVAALLLITSLSSREAPGPSARRSRSDSIESPPLRERPSRSEEMAQIQVGQEAPDFTLPSTVGERVTLSATGERRTCS